jgi:biotin carboxyl carrier protein
MEVGQAVKKGDTVMMIEAMKMENEIKAECDGTIAKFHVAAGQSVMADDKLFDIAAAGAPVAAAPAPVAAPAPKPAATPAPKAEPAAPAAGGPAKALKSPLPGSITKILVTPGQAVKKGETLLMMEAMKMENEIKAEKDGVVAEIKVTVGQNVMNDDVLLTIA